MIRGVAEIPRHVTSFPMAIFDCCVVVAAAAVVAAVVKGSVFLLEIAEEDARIAVAPDMQGSRLGRTGVAYLAV